MNVRPPAKSRWLRRIGWSLLLGTLLLRALVPVGYMPAAIAAGWPVQLCPDGMSAAAMTALMGPAHQHHSPVVAEQTAHAIHAGHHSEHHTEHQPATGGQPFASAQGSAAPQAAMFGQCDLAAFSGALAPPSVLAGLTPMPSALTAFGTTALLHVRSTAFERYRSRAPPA